MAALFKQTGDRKAWHFHLYLIAASVQSLDEPLSKLSWKFSIHYKKHFSIFIQCTCSPSVSQCISVLKSGGPYVLLISSTTVSSILHSYHLWQGSIRLTPQRNEHGISVPGKFVFRVHIVLPLLCTKLHKRTGMKNYASSDLAQTGLFAPGMEKCVDEKHRRTWQPVVLLKIVLAICSLSASSKCSVRFGLCILPRIVASPGKTERWRLLIELKKRQKFVPD